MASRTINVAIAVLTMAAAGAASAQQTTYDYTGASMSGTVSGDELGPDLTYGSYPFCCAALDGSLTLSSPLAPNLVDAPASALSVTFTLTLLNSVTIPPGGMVNSVSPESFTAGGALSYPPSQFGTTLTTNNTSGVLFANALDFTTNATGQITGWDLQLTSPQAPGTGTLGETITTAGDSAVATAADQHGAAYDVSNTTAGSWSPVPTSPVPEIDPSGAGAALTLLAGAIAALRGRRRTLSA